MNDTTQQSASPSQDLLQSETYRILRDVLIEAREAAGLDHTELETRAGCEPGAVVAIEAGERDVDIFELIDLAAVLDINPATLVRSVIAAMRSGHQSASYTPGD